MNKKRRILVTSALPYANGAIHLGHMIEHIQTDIWARFQRLRGHSCVYVCADDAHGTPIMLKARQENCSNEDLIDRVHREHLHDLQGFLVEYDNYYTTHSEENRYFSESIFERAKQKGFITLKTIRQAYDEEAGLFLADRFIKGTCPKCKTSDQYGDNCEACGAIYQASELIDPRSVHSNTQPIEKETDHYFFELGQLQSFLCDYLHSDAVQTEVANKLLEWFEHKEGLADWDISRDGPYWGFKIPGSENQYFYVWLDAPIGYLASFKNLCERRPDLDFDDYWLNDADTEVHHFIGKDIAYFHCLFWPALLNAAGFRLPSRIHVHGFVTVNGAKMSKSRGTFIQARSYLNHLNPEYLRYYFASRLNANIGDIDLNFEDFTQKVNSDLVGKIVNIASRCSGFISKRFDGKLAAKLDDPAAFQSFVAQAEEIAQHYDAKLYTRAVQAVMALADRANQYIDEQKPWVVAKDESQAERLQSICTQALNLYKIIVTYLKPILPSLAEKSEQFLNAESFAWSNLDQPLLDHAIQAYQPLLTRVDPKKVDAMLQENAEILKTQEQQNNKSSSKPNAKTEQTLCDPININVFAQADFRVARIVSAKAVPGAQKLLQLTLDVGELGQRTVFSGISKAYAPENLTDKLTVLVANLKARKMRFGVSEGMILSASGDKDDEIFLLSPDAGAKPGMKVS